MSSRSFARGGLAEPPQFCDNRILRRRDTGGAAQHADTLPATESLAIVGILAADEQFADEWTPGHLDEVPRGARHTLERTLAGDRQAGREGDAKP